MDTTITDPNNIFKTIQKPIKAHKITQASTPHPIYGIGQSHSMYNKKIRIRPTTMKVLSEQVHRMLDDPKKNQEQVIYQLLGRINSIEVINNCYRLDFTDETYHKKDLQIVVKNRQLSTLNSFVSKGSEESLKINEIQFQANQQEGQPYFRLCLKVMIEQTEEKKKPKLIIERCEKVSDSGLINYHNMKIMEAKLKFIDQ